MEKGGWKHTEATHNTINMLHTQYICCLPLQLLNNFDIINIKFTIKLHKKILLTYNFCYFTVFEQTNNFVCEYSFYQQMSIVSGICHHTLSSSL